MVVHVLVIGILLYVGNRIGYLFLAENTGNLSFADNLLTAFNRTFEELSKFSPQFSYEMRSLGIAAVAAISYILFVLYKTFDEKNTRPNEEYGSARWGKCSDIRAFLDKKKDFNILLTKSESLSLSGRMKITRNDNFNRNKNVIVVGGAGMVRQDFM